MIAHLGNNFNLSDDGAWVLTPRMRGQIVNILREAEEAWPERRYAKPLQNSALAAFKGMAESPTAITNVVFRSSLNNLLTHVPPVASDLFTSFRKKVLRIHSVLGQPFDVIEQSQECINDFEPTDIFSKFKSCALLLKELNGFPSEETHHNHNAGLDELSAALMESPVSMEHLKIGITDVLISAKMLRFEINYDLAISLILAGSNFIDELMKMLKTLKFLASHSIGMTEDNEKIQKKVVHDLHRQISWSLESKRDMCESIYDVEEVQLLMNSLPTNEIPFGQWNWNELLKRVEAVENTNKITKLFRIAEVDLSQISDHDSLADQNIHAYWAETVKMIAFYLDFIVNFG